MLGALSLGALFARGVIAADQPDDAEIFSVENSVDAARPAAGWSPARVGQKLAWHDRVRTGEDSRAAIRLSDLSILRLDELTEAEVLPPPESTAKPTVDLKQGTMYFFSREKSREINVRTPAANGGIRGTEFVVTVAADGSTSFTMIEGEVETSNESGSLVVRSGEQAEIKPGGEPAKNAVSNAIDSAQWCFYYPAVLDPRELQASLGDRAELRASLAAYGSGDLLMAVQQYPRDRVPDSPEEKAYRAGLWLITGQVGKAEALLGELDRKAPERRALSTLVAAVTQKERKSAEPPKTASEWLAQSYYLESREDLVGARQAAQRATSINSDFGFGWTRVGELELSLKRGPQAKKALDKAFYLAPRNPAAHALRGFILSADGKLDEAIDAFERAMAVDSALGDAWLGRGLCLLRQGKEKAGRRDLFTAAALEPNRAIFRKYLEGSVDNAGAKSKPRKEPTPRPKVAKPSRPEPAPRPAPAATAEPVYMGRIPGSGISINPNFPPPRPRPRPTARPPRTPSDGTPRPEKTNESTPRPPKGSRPTPPDRQPPPARGAIAPNEPGAPQDQTRDRKKKPRSRPSPTPN